MGINTVSLFKKGKNELANYKAHSIVSRRTTIQGDIGFSGGLHVEGKVLGNIRSEEGCVVVHGEVHGDLFVPNAIINGTVVGNITCSKHLELSGAARVTGVVTYAQMEMHLGAQVTGELRLLNADAAAAAVSDANSRIEKKELRVVP